MARSGRPLCGAARLMVAGVLWGVAQVGAWGATPCPPAFQVAYAESELPPYILGIGEALQDPPGLFVSWTRTAMRKIGCEASLVERRLPYKRIIAGMQTGEIDARVSAGYREGMAQIARYPLSQGTLDHRLAIAEGKTSLYVIKGNKSLRWKGGRLQAVDKTPVVVGTVLGHFSEMVLRDKQWRIDSAPNWESNVQKLLQGRVSAIAGTASVIDALPERSKLQELEPPVAVDLFYAPISQGFYTRYPEFSQTFWVQLCQESRTYFRDLPACPAGGH